MAEKTLAELQADLVKAEEEAKIRAARMAELKLKIDGFGLSEVVKGMGITKLFDKIRAETKNDKLDSMVILTAIGEAAGMTGFQVTKVEKKKATRPAVSKTPEAQELKDAGVALNSAKKKQESAEKRLANAIADSKPQPEIKAKKAEALEAKALADAAREKHAKIKQRNADLKAAKKNAKEAAKK